MVIPKKNEKIRMLSQKKDISVMGFDVTVGNTNCKNSNGTISSTDLKNRNETSISVGNG